MGALSPLFLLAGIAIAVPLYLHLFQRQEARRISFPALRYLERTEREHAKQIRLRQLLLLLARLAALLFVVGAGARLFVSARGTGHPPTAVAIVLDNSLSSSMVTGEIRVLDQLRTMAVSVTEEATPEDRFWIILAGEPWRPALPLTAEEARRALEDAEPSDARGDLSEGLSRARRLLEASSFEHREIHLLSDLQRSAFDATISRPAAEIPVVVWSDPQPAPANRAIVGLTVGGGLPPVQGQRTRISVATLGTADLQDTVSVPARLVVNDRIRGAAVLPPGVQTVIPMPASNERWIEAYVDADPDALRADDRRYFAFESRSAPRVGLVGDPGPFVREAVEVLFEAGRLARTAGSTGADLVVASEGMGLEGSPDEGAILVLPPDDPARLPALNRRLQASGVPWQYATPTGSGEADLEGPGLPAALEGVRVRDWFHVRESTNPPAPARVLAEVGGEPWAVEGTTSSGRRYLLLASPLLDTATDLPLSTGLLRFVDWVATEWAGLGTGLEGRVAGEAFPFPASADRVRTPNGAVVEVDGTRMVMDPATAGLYTFLSGDSVVAVVAVNTPAAESRLARLEPDAFTAAIGAETVRVRTESDWPRASFRSRRGPEIWWPLLLAALVALLIEAGVAASGGTGGARRSTAAATPATLSAE